MTRQGKTKSMYLSRVLGPGGGGEKGGLLITVKGGTGRVLQGSGRL